MRYLDSINCLLKTYEFLAAEVIYEPQDHHLSQRLSYLSRGHFDALTSLLLIQAPSLGFYKVAWILGDVHWYSKQVQIYSPPILECFPAFDRALEYSNLCAFTIG